MNKVYVLGGFRTPVVVKNNKFKNVKAEELGAEVIKAILQKYPIKEDLAGIIGGNAVGTGGNITRLMSLLAGISENVPAYTVDMQCASGAVAISNADGKLKALTGKHGQVVTFDANGYPVATTMQSGGVKKYSTTIGNGSSTSYTVTHNLGTSDICVSAVQVSSNQNVWIQYTINNANSITLTFTSAIASKSIKIVVMG